MGKVFNSIKNNKKICIIVLAILLVFGIGGFTLYNSHEENLRKEQISEISEKYKTFESEEDRTKKVEILKDVIKDFNEYQKEKDVFKEVTEEYQANISIMKDWFISGYETSLDSNTLKDVEKINDKSKLNDAIKNLDNLLKTIKSEESIALTTDEIKVYEDSINKLVDSYENRVKTIEKEEEEAKKKAEEEAKKKKENNSSKTSNSSSSNKKPNSSSSSKKNNSSSSSNWKNGKTYYWWKDENGNITDEWYEDSTGQRYDMNGNKIDGNLKDWLW